ncbi:MAG: hypothetical protein GY771_09340 [bacterium]|nr:hypothetical protein [bacterium]
MKTRYFVGVILLTLLTLTACGAGSGEITRESYNEYGSPAVESFSCSGFGGANTLFWEPFEPYEGAFDDVQYNLYRAVLGSDDYEKVNAKPILASVKYGTEPDNPVISVYSIASEVPFDGHLINSLVLGEPFTYVDGGLKISDEKNTFIYKYRLEAVYTVPSGDNLWFGPIVYRAGFPAAEATNSFLGVGPLVSNGIIEIAIISDREQIITCTVNRAGSEERDIAFERDISPGCFVYRWDSGLNPGEYEMGIPMVGWGEQEFENKCAFTVK